MMASQAHLASLSFGNKSSRSFKRKCAGGILNRLSSRNNILFEQGKIYIYNFQ